MYAYASLKFYYDAGIEHEKAQGITKAMSILVEFVLVVRRSYSGFGR